ncbi:MAG: c-type cytochrome [Anaerolineales bacterium]
MPIAYSVSQPVKRPTQHAIRFYALGALIVLTACSLAEDLTPPPGLALTQAAAATASGPAFPETQPNASAGAALYVQHCAACHGDSGKGDGQLAAQVQGQLPDFTAPEWRRARAPQELFRTITNGRIAQTMPPFGDALSPAERWDVTAYLYTLSMDGSTVEQGQTLYAQHCAACHGDSGKADGPQASGSLPDFTAPQFFAAQTEENFLNLISPGAGAHAFADQLTDDARRAVAALVRALGYQARPSAAPLPSEPGKVTVHGAVTNGTANAAAPDGLPVELHVFNQVAQVGIYTTTVSAGQYSFVNVALEPEQVLIVTLDYGDARYTSQVARFSGNEAQFDLPVEIFETTTDPGGISISRWHVFFNVARPGTVQVGELMIFSNASDRTFVAEGLEVPLPLGAANLQFQDQALAQRIQATPSGFAYAGAVRPGPEALSLLFSFDLPLNASLDFEQATPYPVSAVSVLVPEGTLRVRAGQLAAPERRDVESTPYLSYTGPALPANSALTLTVAPAGAGSNLVWLIAGVGLVALAGAGLWVWQRRRGLMSPAPLVRLDPEQRRAELVAAIAELDEAFEKSDYAEPDYQRRRARLKAEALELMRMKMEADS